MDLRREGSLRHRMSVLAVELIITVLQPPPPGQKRKKQGWENLWYVGMYGGMVLAGVLLYYKPDTTYVVYCLSETTLAHRGPVEFRHGHYKKLRPVWRLEARRPTILDVSHHTV